MLSVVQNSKQKDTIHLVADGVFDPGTVPVWSIDKTGVVGLFPAEDGMSCTALATSVGSVTLTVTASANGKVLTVTATITVTPQFATVLQLNADAPVAQ